MLDEHSAQGKTDFFKQPIVKSGSLLEVPPAPPQQATQIVIAALRLHLLLAAVSACFASCKPWPCLDVIIAASEILLAAS